MKPVEAAEFFDVVLSVLGYQEEGEWAALALEMDLRGYGATFEEALAELRELVLDQIGFAIFKGQPEMVWKPAGPVWWELFATARQQSFRNLVRRPAAGSLEYRVGGIPVPPPHVIDALKADGWAGPSSSAS